MKLSHLFSVYITRQIKGGEGAFNLAKQFFEESNQIAERQWKSKEKERFSIEYKKGNPVAFTFDYSDGALEIKARINFCPESEVTTIACGNSGFPFECWLSRHRYARMADKIVDYVSARIDCALA